VVAVVCFLPIIAFFAWAMQYDESLSAHGIGSRERWLGERDSPAAAPGGDD
jgi:NNP family nitrate/nitrite transporter-like MFS transporter